MQFELLFFGGTIGPGSMLYGLDWSLMWWGELFLILKIMEKECRLVSWLVEAPPLVSLVLIELVSWFE